MANLIGRTLLRRYQVLEALGRGGMADVYRVWDKERAAYLAIKVLPDDLAQDELFLRRFRREAQVLETLQHPHIVRYYGLEQEDILCFMLMDFIAGSTLRTAIFRKKAPFSPLEIRAYWQPICAALHFAHTRGVIHCDIKPANILIDATGRVFVSDFGVARLTESASVTFATLGTPTYMSPEQCRGGEELDVRTDVYALGVILYELASGGQRPFHGLQQTTRSIGDQIRWQHLNERPPSPRQFVPELSRELEHIILHCLAKRPADRFQSVGELWQAFEEAVNRPTPIAAITPPPPPPAAPAGSTGGQPRPQKRPSILVWAAIFGLVICLGGATLGCMTLSLLAVTQPLFPTATLSPTFTLVPTRTPRPTRTPTASPTFTPTPTPPHLYLPVVQVNQAKKPNIAP